MTTTDAPKLIAPGNIGDLITCLSALNFQDFQYELKKLRALREWAFERAGINYEEGDKVRLNDEFFVSSKNRDGSPNGWWHYRECLAGGALGTAVRIDFSPYQMAWYTDFRPDREWSVSQERNGTVRRWHGPAADTPAGYEPPSTFDQEHYPDGRKHIFSMRAEQISKLPEASDGR